MTYATLVRMIEASDAYVVTQHLHNTFFGINDVLSEAEIVASNVHARIGSTTSVTSQRLEVNGERNSFAVSQTLAQGMSGNFSVYGPTERDVPERTHIQQDIRRDVPSEMLEVIVGSLFMRALVDAANSRS
jgi:hypothetical protein